MPEHVVENKLFVFSTGLDPATTIRGQPRKDMDWPATHLAVLDVLLVLNGPVDQDRDQFSAVRATDGGFLNDIWAQSNSLTAR